jgi:hypothetical protein
MPGCLQMPRNLNQSIDKLPQIQSCPCHPIRYKRPTSNRCADLDSRRSIPYVRSLSRRLVRRVRRVATIVVHRERAETGRQEREGVVATIAAVRGPLVGIRVSRGERCLSGTAVEWCGVHSSVGHIAGAHGRVWASATHARRKSIGAGRGSVLLWGVSAGKACWSVGPSARCATHGGRTHAET